MNADDAFDAGVTALGRDDHPSAIAYLLVARDAAPRDDEIARALEAARGASGGRVHIEAPFPVGASDLALVLVLVNLALCAAIALRARRPVLILALFAWVLAAAAWAVFTVTRPDYAVVTQAETKTYAADDTGSLERYRLNRGDELVIEAEREGWLKVSGPEGPAYLPAEHAFETTHLGNDGHR